MEMAAPPHPERSRPHESMASVFPRWSNTAFRVALAILVLGVVTAIAAPMIYVRTEWNTRQNLPIEQPVQFDHRHHVQDDAIACRFCHHTVERAGPAGMPDTALCMGCHSQIWNQSPKLQLVRASYFSDTPIVWNRVYNVPDFVYFSHAAHVNKGVGCVTCHGRVDRMPDVHQVTPLTMGWCIDCHRAPERHLRPLSAITDMEWDAGPDAERIGRQVAEELGVRRLIHCSTCHR
ncbi:cytochrome C [Sorangium cellulosum]|uniref:Cytochrome C n=2 Tax=Sorangium cellulosum TaxID=56 RepID=A0A4P2Q346_SORCE|nr:cytochrome C [Sorangium cellulosum]